jgi:hypothetical protein
MAAQRGSSATHAIEMVYDGGVEMRNGRISVASSFGSLNSQKSW